MKFAVHVYTALNSCNYVKFFKLVRTAAFLNVCILHRYFNQMRACCLQRLRAYVMPGHTVAVSLHFYVLFSLFVLTVVYKVKAKSKPNKALDKNSSLIYRTSPAIWDHIVLPSERAPP